MSHRQNCHASDAVIAVSMMSVEQSNKRLILFGQCLWREPVEYLLAPGGGTRLHGGYISRSFTKVARSLR